VKLLAVLAAGCLAGCAVEPMANPSSEAASNPPEVVFSPGRHLEVAVLDEPGVGSEAVMDVAWSPDGRQVAAVTFGGHVAAWDARSGRRLFQRDFAFGYTAPVAYTSDGALLIIGDPIQGDGEPDPAATLLLLDARTGRTVRRVVTRKPDGEMLRSPEWEGSLVVSPTTGFIAVVERGGGPNRPQVVAVFRDDSFSTPAFVQVTSPPAPARRFHAQRATFSGFPPQVVIAGRLTVDNPRAGQPVPEAAGALDLSGAPVNLTYYRTMGYAALVYAHPETGAVESVRPVSSHRISMLAPLPDGDLLVGTETAFRWGFGMGPSRLPHEREGDWRAAVQIWSGAGTLKQQHLLPEATTQPTGALHPSGEIVFWQAQSGSGWFMNASRLNPWRQILEKPLSEAAWEMKWSPAGDQIAIVHRSELFVIPVQVTPTRS